VPAVGGVRARTDPLNLPNLILRVFILANRGLNYVSVYQPQKEAVRVPLLGLVLVLVCTDPSAHNTRSRAVNDSLSGWLSKGNSCVLSARVGQQFIRRVYQKTP
jgi:hypothetical protein